MKIKVKYQDSETNKTRNQIWDLEDDMGITKEEWFKMSPEKKEELLIETIENQKQFWDVVTYTSKN